MEDTRVPLIYEEKNGRNNLKDFTNMPQFSAFQPFVDRYPKYALQMDGILDYDVWNKDDLHIMFLLKDSYRTTNYDYLWSYVIDNCHDMAAFKDRTWKNALSWINCIRSGFGYHEEISDISSIAYMNISKLAIDGNQGTRTRKSTLYSAVENDSDLLYNQLKSISPKIVICCGVHDGKALHNYLFKMIAKAKKIEEEKLPKEIISKENKRLYAFSLYNMLIFSSYHPSSNITKTNDFNGLFLKYGELFRNILKNPVTL